MFTKFSVVLLQLPNKNIQNITKLNRHVIAQRTCSKHQNDHGSETVLVSKIAKDLQRKCEECIPCKMAGNSFEAKISVSEINYSPRYRKQTKKCTKIQAPETLILISIVDGRQLVYVKRLREEQLKLKGTKCYIEWIDRNNQNR